MTTPNYCIRLSGDDLTSNSISCTGEQLCTILNVLSTYGGSLTWYLADVSVISNRKDWLSYESRAPRLIGNSDKLMGLSKKVEQFTSGVFLGIVESDNSKLWTKTYDTEDFPFIDNECTDIEIRAFDTTYFEIYSHNIEILNPFIKRFGCELTKNQDKKK